MSEIAVRNNNKTRLVALLNSRPGQLSAVEAASLLGCSDSVVRRYAQELNLPIRVVGFGGPGQKRPRGPRLP